MKDTLRCFVLMGFGIFIGYLAFLIWPFTPFSRTAKDWVDVLATFGTCAAALIALWLGLKQDQGRKSRELLRARLIASRLLPQFRFARDGARSLDAQLGFYDSFQKTEPQFFSRMVDTINAIRLDATTDDLVALAAFRNHVGYRAARAVGLIDLTAIRMNARLKSIPDIPFHEGQAHQFGELVSEADDLLRVVVAELEVQAATLTDLSTEELYGPGPYDTD
ncbi:hypothetical protein [Paraburkholderia xenovorans]